MPVLFCNARETVLLPLPGHPMTIILCILGISELNYNGRATKGADGRSSVLHIEHLRVAIVLVVHMAEVGIGIEHGFLGFNAVILDELARYANPRTVLECTDLCLRICRELL